jgi:hypothetical protein
MFHHGTILELVFDRYVRFGRAASRSFSKWCFGYDILLVGVVCFLVAVIVVGSNYNPLGYCFCPFLRAFSNSFRWHCPTAARDRLPITRNKGSPNCLLTEGMLGGDIKQPLGGVWLIMAELMHQGIAHCAKPEH